MSPRDEAHALRVTGYEVALWVFGVAAVGAAVWADQWANRTLSLANGGYYCDAAGNCTERYDFVLTQTVLALAPSLLAAGLVALIVALALRAAAVVLQRSRDAVRVAEISATTDHGRFMRPPGQ